MIKFRLAYAACDVRRAVTRQRSLLVNPEQLIGRSERLELRTSQPSSPS
jgi:hypothetical protein